MGISARSGWWGTRRGSVAAVAGPIILTMLVLMKLQPVVLVDDALLLATRLLVV